MNCVKIVYGLVWLVTLSGMILILESCSSKENDPQPPPPVTVKEIGKAQNWLTTGNKASLLAKQTDVSITEHSQTTFPIITIDATTTLQEIEGFGAALTGSAAYVINQKMSQSQRQVLLQELFNPESGIGITALRLTIGSSDFSLTDFTYNDMPAGQTDYPLANFSIAVEQTDLLPVLKSINTISPSLTIIASPWSPPAWMKTNDHLHGGSLKADVYSSYANYFLKYIQAMNGEGIDIDAITIQNEPLHQASYPSMGMSAEEQKNFIKNNLGPLFQRAAVDTKIIIYDHNWDNTQYAISILNDPAANAYVAGSAFHAYGGDVSAMSVVRNAHPDKGLYFTEISGGEWATDFSSNLQWNMANIFIGTTKNWSKTALLWNLALDENFGPQNNGCSDCRGVVTINSSTGAVTRNVEYYAIGHFSKFIRNGAHRVQSSTSAGIPNVDFVAFKNPDGSVVIVLSNTAAEPRTVTVRESQAQINVSLPAESVATITWTTP